MRLDIVRLIVRSHVLATIFVVGPGVALAGAGLALAASGVYSFAFLCALASWFCFALTSRLYSQIDLRCEQAEAAMLAFDEEEAEEDDDDDE